MKNLIYKTKEQAVQAFSDTKMYKSCLMGYDALTSEELTGGKKNPMQGRVEKIHNGFLALIFTNKIKNSYESMINKRLVEQGLEPNFSVGNLSWGTRVSGTPLIEHKGQFYMQTIQFQTSEKLNDFCERNEIELTETDNKLVSQLKDKVVGYNTPFGSIEYLLDGELIDKSQIEGLKTPSSEGKQGGLDDSFKVIVRTFKMSSLKRITFNGSTYIIVD